MVISQYPDWRPRLEKTLLQVTCWGRHQFGAWGKHLSELFCQVPYIQHKRALNCLPRAPQQPKMTKSFLKDEQCHAEACCDRFFWYFALQGWNQIWAAADTTWTVSVYATASRWCASNLRRLSRIKPCAYWVGTRVLYSFQRGVRADSGSEARRRRFWTTGALKLRKRAKEKFISMGSI